MTRNFCGLDYVLMLCRKREGGDNAKILYSGEATRAKKARDEIEIR